MVNFLNKLNIQTTLFNIDEDEDSIKEKLEYIINLSKDEVATVGVNGQKRLLSVRNYERIAADLAHQLNIL